MPSDITYGCNSITVCTSSWPIYTAQVDFAYVGGQQIEVEVVNVETETASVPFIVDYQTCVGGECLPFHRAVGCAQ